MGQEGWKWNLLRRLFAGRGKADSDEEGEESRARRLERRLTSLTLGRHSPKPRDKQRKEKDQKPCKLVRSKTAPALTDGEEEEIVSAETGELPTATEDGEATDTKPTSKLEDDAVEDEDGEPFPQNQGSPASATSPGVKSSDPDVAIAISVLTAVTAGCSSFDSLSDEQHQDELLAIVRQMPVLLTPEGRRENPKRADIFLAEVYEYPESATWGPIESFDVLCQKLEFLCRARAKPTKDKNGIGVV